MSKGSDFGPLINGGVILLGASCILVVYVLTLSPSIAGGDSGELVAEGCTLGIAHPPGYPLFTLLVYTLAKYTKDWFRGGEAVYPINLSSAAFTSLASLFIGHMVISWRFFESAADPKKSSDGDADDRKISASALPGALLAMGMFAFSPLIWQYAVTAEVFPLNTFFCALLCYLTVKFGQEPRASTALLGAFVSGLALTNQHTSVLLEAPLILWILWLMRRHLFPFIFSKAKTGSKSPPLLLWGLVFAFLLGLSPYAYLPIAHRLKPEPGSWGRPSTLQGFLHHFLRRDYGTFQLFSGESGKQTEGFFVRCTAYLSDVFGTQGLGIVPIFALVAFASILGSMWKSQGRSRATRGSSAAAAAVSKTTKKSRVGKQKADPSPTGRGNEGCKGGDHDDGDDDDTATCDVLGVVRAEAQLTWRALFGAFLFYFAVFHNLANLPLQDPLLFGVHQVKFYRRRRRKRRRRIRRTDKTRYKKAFIFFFSCTVAPSIFLFFVCIITSSFSSSILESHPIVKSLNLSPNHLSLYSVSGCNRIFFFSPSVASGSTSFCSFCCVGLEPNPEQELEQEQPQRREVWDFYRK
jgi:hypothetical protein